MATSMGATLTLHEAADELGVHYMTVYRYVRHGLLEASKPGGTWQVEVEALERFRAGEQGPVEPGEKAPWSERFESRLMAGDTAGSWGVIEAAMAAGNDLDALYLEVVAPALASIGARWERGEIDVAVEHVASGVATRMMGRLGHRFARRGRSRGVVVVGAVADEAHALPVAMIGDLLRLRGWSVTDLGADVPAASWSHAVSSASDAVGAGVSVMGADLLPAAGEVCHAIKAARPDVSVVLGGRAIESDEHAVALGADGFARSAAEMDALLQRRARGAGGVTGTHSAGEAASSSG